MTSSIKKGAIISYVSIFLNIVISFFYTPWMIRQIGVSDYGLYSLIYSFISYFLMDFGLHQAVQRFIAKYRAENDEDKISKMVAITTKCYLAIDILIFIILFVLYFFISNIFTGLTTEEIERLKELYIIAGIFSVLNFMFKPMNGAMMAYEYFVEERLLEMVNRVGTVLLVCVALYMGADVFALILITGATSLVVSIAKYVVFQYKSKLHIQWRYYNREELRSVFSFSMWTFVVSIAQKLRVSLVPTVLGIVSNSNEIAVFSVGMVIEGFIFTISSALNGLFLPKVSRLSINNNKTEITKLMIRVGRLQLYVWGLIFSGFFIFGNSFLHLWVGDKFINSYYVLIFIGFHSITSLTQSIAMDLVYAENKIRHTAKLTIISAVIGFVISFPLAKYYGAIGAAAGSGFGLCLYQILLNIFYSKKLNLQIISFFKECHIMILPTIMTVGFVSYILVGLNDNKSWPVLISEIILYSIIYVFVLYYFNFNREEKNHLMIFRNKKI
ncbi:MAG: oligosaccharide flippase family protein [Butyrivibrio sp.]|nr:oligosaccharide flippase family protein [Butyrivibrio sp.]